mgnify:CR=1 FL=1
MPSPPSRRSLETFLGGMEMSSILTIKALPRYLETFLGGMEISRFMPLGVPVAPTLKPSLVEWK